MRRQCLAFRHHAPERDGPLRDPEKRVLRFRQSAHQRLEGTNWRLPAAVGNRLAHQFPHFILAIEDQILLAAEVVEHRLPGDIGLIGDVCDGHLVEAVFDEQARCDLGDRLTRHFLLAVAEFDSV